MFEFKDPWKEGEGSRIKEKGKKKRKKKEGKKIWFADSLRFWEGEGERTKEHEREKRKKNRKILKI